MRPFIVRASGQPRETALLCADIRDAWLALGYADKEQPKAVYGRKVVVELLTTSTLLIELRNHKNRNIFTKTNEQQNINHKFLRPPAVP